MRSWSNLMLLSLNQNKWHHQFQWTTTGLEYKLDLNYLILKSNFLNSDYLNQGIGPYP